MQDSNAIPTHVIMYGFSLKSEEKKMILVVEDLPEIESRNTKKVNK